MNFSASVAVVDSSAIRLSRASFSLEARDIFSNPLGQDANHGPWNLPSSYYTEASAVVVDVCDGFELRDQASLAGEIYGTAGRRLLQQDATQSECDDLFIQIKSYSVTLQVRTHSPHPRNLNHRPFSRPITRSCAARARRWFVGRYSG
jgi:hypothetical protein